MTRLRIHNPSESLARPHAQTTLKGIATPLEDINEAIDTFLERRDGAMKVVVHP